MCDTYKMEADYRQCRLCPRECNINRESGAIGYCKASGSLRVARAALHMWEEPCISGDRESDYLPGSGTIFFSGCSLRCVFCQNHAIAADNYGKEITVERLAEIMLRLQDEGAANINLVTPTHYLVSVLEALKIAKPKLHIPVVYNTGGYERVECLKLLEGYVDVYLPDFKYMDNDLAAKYSHAADYPKRAKEALAEMVRQTGTPKFDDKGMMKKGVIVRHLMLPGQLLDSKRVLRYLYETYENQIYISIMNQYTPLPWVEAYPELNRKVSRKSYEKLVDYALDLGITQAYIQEGEAAKESFIPDFTCEGV